VRLYLTVAVFMQIILLELKDNKQKKTVVAIMFNYYQITSKDSSMVRYARILSQNYGRLRFK